MTYPAADHLQILNVMHGYTMAVDDGDVDALRNSFHPDARIEAFGAVFSVDDYCASIPRMVAAMNPTHIIGNEHVVVDGDKATARSYVWAMHKVAGGTSDPGAVAIFGAVDADTDSLIIGKYFDSFEKRDGVWRFSRKVIKVRWQQHMPTMPPVPGWANM